MKRSALTTALILWSSVALADDLSGLWAAEDARLILSNGERRADVVRYDAELIQLGRAHRLEAEFDGRELRLTSPAQNPSGRAVGAVGHMEFEATAASLQAGEERPDRYRYHAGPGQQALQAVSSSLSANRFERLRDDRVVHVCMDRISRFASASLSVAHEIVDIRSARSGQDRLADAQGHVHELSGPAQVEGFVRTLGLPEADVPAVVQAIAQGPSGARDELAQLARVWAPAQQGQAIPNRLVISGRHVAAGVWGMDNGRLDWSALARLARALPRAAAQVEDLHVRANHTAGPLMSKTLRRIFPGLHTLWTYERAPNPIVVHALRDWERATRGARAELVQAVEQTTPRESVYAVVDGVVRYGGDAYAFDAADDVLDELEALMPRYEAILNGAPQKGPDQFLVRGFYDRVQRALATEAARGLERDLLEEVRDQAFRLARYDLAAEALDAHHAEALRAGYATVGHTEPPAFAGMSREWALQEIARFRARADGGHPAAQALLKVFEGFEALDGRTLREEWFRR